MEDRFLLQIQTPTSESGFKKSLGFVPVFLGFAGRDGAGDDGGAGLQVGFTVACKYFCNNNSWVYIT